MITGLLNMTALPIHKETEKKAPPVQSQNSVSEQYFNILLSTAAT